MAVTDKLRAAVFARDKAICSFSGLSLWILDFGTAPFSHPDWVDHARPASRGGAHTIDNLVCASFFYNRKKLSNGSDREYLFAEGRPTETFFWTHGELSADQAALLARHQAIEQSDWYFNRALFNITVALENRLSRQQVARKREYWLGSAYKRLLLWRKLAPECGASTFLHRGLVRHPNAPDVQLMLELATADRSGVDKIFDRLFVPYRANATTLASFLRATSRERRREVIQSAEAAGRATEPLLGVLRNNAARIP